MEQTGGKAEVKALIALWLEEDVQHALDDPLIRNTKIYQRISKELLALGYSRNAESICNKLKALKHKNLEGGGQSQTQDESSSSKKVSCPQPAMSLCYRSSSNISAVSKFMVTS